MNTVNRERWASLSLAEQMANIGSEVGRSAKWLTKNKPDLAEGAFHRATELMDLTLDYGRQGSPGRDALSCPMPTYGNGRESHRGSAPE